MGYIACFELDGKWYAWADRSELHGSAAWLTAPATPETIYETMVIVFVAPLEDHTLPRSEQEALGEHHWRSVIIDSIDRAAGTFKVQQETFSIAATRMVLKDPEPLRMP